METNARAYSIDAVILILHDDRHVVATANRC